MQQLLTAGLVAPGKMTYRVPGEKTETFEFQLSAGGEVEWQVGQVHPLIKHDQYIYHDLSAKSQLKRMPCHD